MFAKTFVIAAALAAAVVSADDFQVPTPPSANQCQPLQISWTGGQGPFYPRVTKAGSTSDTIPSTIPNKVDSSPLTWNVNVPSGTQFTIVVGDSTGVVKNSATVTVGEGNDSCMNGGSSGSSSAASSSTGSSGKGGAAAAGAGGAAAGAAGGAAAGSSGKGSSKSGSSGSSGSSSSSASPSSSSSSASSSDASSSMSSSGAMASATDSMASSAAAATSSMASGASTFSGLPAVVAGVVGIAVAALL